MCHVRMAVMHLPKKICANSSIQFGVIDIFRNPRQRPPPSLIFKSCTFGTFRHVNSVVLELYIKFDSNICDSHTYVHLMTSHELTSGFEFWSGGHLRMAVVHLPIKFGVDICIQSWVIDIFPKFKMAAPPSWIFRLCEFGYSGVLTVWYLCSVPNWVKIYALVTEIDALMRQTFIWWRHAN